MDGKITEAELLEELRTALGDPGPDDAYTANEIAELMGCSVELARKRIKLLIGQGKMKPTRAARPRMDGQVQKISAYQFVA